MFMAPLPRSPSNCPAIREEGYTRIYPLGALELGWPGEAGPDPSVFSVWDGVTVRRDMGGLEGLLALKKEADKLGMKIVLCALSHFSRAQCDYPYHYPSYIGDQHQDLSRRGRVGRRMVRVVRQLHGQYAGLRQRPAPGPFG